MALYVVKFLIQVGTLQNELLGNSNIDSVIHLPPIWKSRESIIAVWIALAFLFHAIVAYLVRRYKAEWKDNYEFWMGLRAMKKGICPHRRARWMKCYRRANRLRQQRSFNSEEGEEGNNEEEQQGEEDHWQCPFEASFWKVQMPPPLPLRHRKHKKQQQSNCSVHQAPVAEINAMSTIESETAALERGEVSPSRDLSTGNSGLQAPQEKPQPLMSHHHVLPTRSPVAHSSLIDMARMQHWEAIQTHVNRREAKHHDSDGLYPLHWACSGSPPVEVIKVLLHAYRGAARKSDSEGSLALHFATHYGASADVVETVLKAYEPAIRKQDKYGRTPLFHAVAKAAGLEVLRILVSADPSMVTTPCLPPDKAKKYRNQLSYWVKRTPLYLGWSAVLSDRQARQRRSGRVWDKAQFLLEAAFLLYRDLHPSVPRNYNFSVVHAAVAMDSLLPVGVVELAIQAQPQQLQEPDEIDGRLPLAVAASTPYPSPGRSDLVIKLLLDAFPAATRILDSKGRTPLVLATLSGKTWDAGVGRLLQADPDVIDWRDPVTGLYPFNLAALVSDDDVPIEDDDAFEASSSNLEETEDMIALLPGKVLESLRRQRNNSEGDKSSSSSSSSGGSSLSVSSSLSSSCGDSPSQRISTIYQLLQANPSIIS